MQQYRHTSWTSYTDNMGSLPQQYSFHPPYDPHDPSNTNGRRSTAAASSSSTRHYIDNSRRGFGMMDDQAHQAHQPVPGMDHPSFDILEWHPAYQSCQRYFLDHAQHEPATQAVCALINIRLPHQWLATPITSSQPASSTPGGGGGSQQFNFNVYSRSSGGMNSPRSRGSSNNNSSQSPTFVSPIPYIRRLIVTGFDKPAILHGFFGDDFERGIMPHVECERRNYLFAAKHGGWRSCKKQYDVGSGYGGDESVPFMKPLAEAKMQELTAAEKAWSDWLAMEDWMVGPRAPNEERERERDAGRYGQSEREGGASVNADGGELPDGLSDGYRDR